MAEYFVYNGGLYSTDELKHYGVKGMKWGVHKSVYKSMNKQQRKAQRQKYKQSPEGRIKRATNIGTVLGGPLGGVIANHLATKRINQLTKDDLDRGKQIVEKHKNTKIETNNKIKELAKKGEIFINNNPHLLDIPIQQANQVAMQEATRASINASLQAASLSASGGMNPFMFGMI